MTSKGFEAILDTIGHFGPAQALILLFSIALETTSALVVYFFMFEGGNPGFQCANALTEVSVAGPGDQNASYRDVTTASPNVTTGQWDSKCPTQGMCENLTFSEEYTSVVTEVSSRRISCKMKN